MEGGSRFTQSSAGGPDQVGFRGGYSELGISGLGVKVLGYRVPKLERNPSTLISTVSGAEWPDFLALLRDSHVHLATGVAPKP